LLKECEISPAKMRQIYRIIGNNVKKARSDQGITQLELAHAIGHKAVGTVSMAEICLNNKHFNLEHLVKIADVLEIDLCKLLEDIAQK
jgi:transcriptional regulator with XRE-family HTH domain